MPTLNGIMPRNAGDVPEAPCVWCRQPTDLRFVPAGMPHLGPQPLHITCGVQLIRAFERWQRGLGLSEPQRKRLAALADPY